MKKTIFLMLLAAAVMAGCGGGKAKKQDGGETTEQAESKWANDPGAPELVITYMGVSPFNFAPGNATHEVEDFYKIEYVGEGTWDQYVVRDTKNNVVIRREYEVITVYSPLFKTEEGVHVDMPVAEAVKLMGDDLRIYGSLENGYSVCRHFGGPDTVEEDDAVSIVMSGDAVKAESREKLAADSSKVTADDFTPEAKVERISIVELL